jgi:hypothetical protein
MAPAAPPPTMIASNPPGVSVTVYRAATAAASGHRN